MPTAGCMKLVTEDGGPTVADYVIPFELPVLDPGSLAYRASVERDGEKDHSLLRRS